MASDLPLFIIVQLSVIATGSKNGYLHHKHDVYLLKVFEANHQRLLKDQLVELPLSRGFLPFLFIMSVAYITLSPFRKLFISLVEIKFQNLIALFFSFSFFLLLTQPQQVDFLHHVEILGEIFFSEQQIKWHVSYTATDSLQLEQDTRHESPVETCIENRFESLHINLRPFDLMVFFGATYLQQVEVLYGTLILKVAPTISKKFVIFTFISMKL